MKNSPLVRTNKKSSDIAEYTSGTVILTSAPPIRRSCSDPRVTKRLREVLEKKPIRISCQHGRKGEGRDSGFLDKL